VTDFQTANDYRDSTRPARVEAVSAFGFTERQARFLVNVMVHSGVFLERHCAFAGITHGQKSHDFIAKLTGRRYTTVITPGALHRGRLFQVQYKPLYEAIGEPDNRHRKAVSVGRMIERLMILDAVLADCRYTWLGTERDKLAYFILMLQTGLQPHEYPHITFGEGPEKVIRCFPDKLPIGIEKNGFRRHVFLYLITREGPLEFRMFLLRHAELLRSMPEWTVRLLIPKRFKEAAARYRYAFRDEVAMPLDPSTVEELEQYFPERQRMAGHLSAPADEDLARAFRKFGAARFQALYRMWQHQGNRALWAARSHVLRDALARGYGRLECVELSHQYLQLTSLVGVA
jgi:hypothetical protein